MKRLSDIEMGRLRHLLSRVVDFVDDPAPIGEPHKIEQWCDHVCAVKTPDQVANCWAKHVFHLGLGLDNAELANALRKGRPALPRNLLLADLNTCEEFAGAILCLAVDKAEADDIFRRARLAADLETEFPYEERKRAASQRCEAWQIVEVLAKMLLVDQDTLRRFTGAMRAIVESLFVGAAAPLTPERAGLWTMSGGVGAQRDNALPPSPGTVAKVPAQSTTSLASNSGHAEKLKQYRRGPEAKRAKVLKRNQLIEQAMKEGITDEQEVFNYVLEKDATLLRARKKGNQPISVQSMMKAYKEAQEA